MYVIEDSEIKLINCTEDIIISILAGADILAEHIKAKVDNQWSRHGRDIFKYTLEQLKKPNADPKWLSYLLIDKKTNTLIGNGGYKGSPDNNTVEIGYEVSPNWINQGKATSLVKLVIKNAFETSLVDAIKANTLAEHNASTSVLQKLNFQLAERQSQNSNQLFWHWILYKENYRLIS